MPCCLPSTRPLWGSLLLLSACATREVPSHYPESSAASPRATAAPALQVSEALAEDPPLPGSGQSGWRGLSPREEATVDAGTVDPHAHHRGHHGH